MVERDFEKFFAQLREAEDRAWWKDLTHLVGETDRQLVVLGPTSDATTDDLKTLGKTLEEWQSNFRQARHIWGLSDLLKGEPPRTPPIYLMVPQSMENYADCYEPGALVYVAESTDLEKRQTRFRRNCPTFIPGWYGTCRRRPTAILSGSDTATTGRHTRIAPSKEPQRMPIEHFAIDANATVAVEKWGMAPVNG